MFEQTENTVKKAGRPKVKRPVYKAKDKFTVSVSGTVSPEIAKKLKDEDYLRSHRCATRSDFIRTAIAEKDERLDLNGQFEAIKSDLNRQLLEIKSDLMTRLMQAEMINEDVKTVTSELINVVNILSNGVKTTADNQADVDKKLTVISKMMVPIADFIRDKNVSNQGENHG